MSFSYKIKKIQNPKLHVHNDIDENNQYGSSLSALDSAWDSVAAAKKQFTHVDHKFRNAKSSSESTRKVVFSEKIPPPGKMKPSNNPPIERRIVYENMAMTNYPKENIPPTSYPEPISRYNYTDIKPAGSEFIPFRQDLYGAEKSKTTPSIVDQPNFNFHPSTCNPKDMFRINSSLTGRSLLKFEQKSNALAKLKEKITQQKINSSLSSNQSTDSLFPQKQAHDENDIVKTQEDRIHPDECFITRKVAQAPSAPSYKGFNQAEETFTKVLSTRTIPKQMLFDNNKTVKDVNKIPNKQTKGNAKRRKVNTHRVVAPKKSTPKVTTSSWRIGLEIQQKVKQQLKAMEVQEKNTKVKKTDPDSLSKIQNKKTESEELNSESGTLSTHPSIPKDKPVDRPIGGLSKSSRSDKSDRMDHTDSDGLEEQGIDEPLTNQQDQEAITQQSDLGSLQEQKGLTKTAKDVLMEMNSKTKEDLNPLKKRIISAVVDTGLKKKIKQNISSRKSPPVKRKSEEDICRKHKLRHYDQEDIQRYMAKQQAQRRRERLDEKKKQCRLKTMQEQKLQELYDKQKAAVKDSLEQKKRSEYGATFIKYKAADSMKNLKDALSRMQQVTQTSIELPVVLTPSNPRYRDLTLMREETFHDSLDDNDVCISEKTRSLDYKDSPTSLTPSSCTNSSAQQNSEADLRLNPSVQSPPPDAYNKSKADRVAAIRATAAALRQRLDAEAKRFSELVRREHHALTTATTTNDPNRWAHPISIVPSSVKEPFGTYPGIDNIDAHASLNTRLKSMDDAAKRIQALYRGHNVRKSMNWELPSGRSLYQTLEEARRRAFLNDIHNTPVTLTSSAYPSVMKQKTTVASGYKQEELTASTFSKDASNESEQSHWDASAHLHETSKKFKSSHSLSHADKSYITSTNTSRTTKLSNTEAAERISFPSYSLNGGKDVKRQTCSTDDHTERLRDVLKKYKNENGDRYSIINIFAKNYVPLRQHQVTKNIDELSNIPLSPEGTDTEEILAAAYNEDIKPMQRTTSNSISPTGEYLTEESYKGLPTDSPEKTISADRPTIIQSQRVLLSPKTARSDSETSERLFSPISLRQDTLTPQKPSKIISHEFKTPDSIIYSFTETEKSEIDHSTAEQQSPSSFSDIDQQDLNPVLTSTKRSTNDNDDVDQTASSMTPLSHHEKPSKLNVLPVNRMSPNTLERRLKAEINMFDAVGDSLQQVNEMEKVRNIVHAQQETVSLAQVLKSRHLAHQQELEKMSLEAKERALKSSHEIERARQATAEASANALKAIADVKIKASEDISKSTKHLVDIQTQATSTTMEAMNRVEEARQNAATAYKFSVDRQLTDVEKIATAAASAASSTAVELALRHHREQLEELRRKAFAKVSKSYSSTSYTESSKNSQNSHTKASDDSSQSKHTKSTSYHSKTLISSYSERFENKDDFSDKTLTEELPTVHSVENISEEITSKANQTISEQTRPTSAKATSSRSISTAKDSLLSGDASKVLRKNSSSSGSIGEDIKTSSRQSIAEDTELAEALFSADKKTDPVSSITTHNDSLQSEKFHSSFTEEDFKNDFHMVLPSENHRRQSLDRKDFLQSVNDSSSDELATPRVVGKWTKKHTKAPFSEEDTFARFTAEMVRQYVQEEEVRAKHQAALLGLREQAIIDKTTAEMTYLERQKKSLKRKEVSDEKMPPINKKQRALLMRLQAEQTEIRRLREAYKQASYERQAMLNQEKDIQRIRERTQRIWNKMETFDKRQTVKKEENVDMTSLSKYESDHSIAEDDTSLLSKAHASEDIPEDLAENSALSLAESIVTTANDVTDNASLSRIAKKSIVVDKSVSETTSVSLPKEETSVAQDLRKLKYMASKRYLTDREKKLQSNKQQFNVILERQNKLKSWRQKIKDEEEKLKKDIRRVLEKKDDKSEYSSQQDSDVDKTLSQGISEKLSTQESGRKASTVVGSKKSEAETSIEEDVPSIVDDNLSEKDSSIAESISKDRTRHPTTNSVSQSLSMKTGKSSNTDTEKSSTKNRLPGSSTQSYGYTNDDFEEPSSKTSQKRSATRRVLESKINDEDSYTEATSDASDIEQRLKGLENELQRRRSELQRLRKKKEKESLRRKEQELRTELQAVEQLIHSENKEAVESNNAASRLQQPRVLSPRTSLDSSRLSERIKLPIEREPKRNLDFNNIKKTSDVWDKELSLESEPKKSDSILSDISAALKEDSKSKTLPLVSVKDDRSHLQGVEEISCKEDISSSSLSNKTLSNTNMSSTGNRSKSISEDTRDEVSIKSMSSISQRDVTDEADSHKDPLLKEPPGSPSEEKSESLSESILSAKSHSSKTQPGDAIYDDDFFISQTSHRVSFPGKDVNTENTCANNDGAAYEDDFEETLASTKYLSKKESTPATVEEIDGAPGCSGPTTCDQRGVSPDGSHISEVLEEESIKSNLGSFASNEKVLSTDIPITGRLSASSESQKTSNSSGTPSQDKSEHLGSVPIDASMQDDEYILLKQSLSTSPSSLVVQPDAFSKSDATSTLGFHLNDRVMVEDTMEGTIRFLGKTSFSPVLVSGVELDQSMGTNNGTFQGKQYFVCADDHGLFTTVDRLKLLENRKPDSNKVDERKSESSTVDEVEESLSQHSVVDKIQLNYDNDVEKSGSQKSDNLRSATSKTSEPKSNQEHISEYECSNSGKSENTKSLSTLEPKLDHPKAKSLDSNYSHHMKHKDKIVEVAVGEEDDSDLSESLADLDMDINLDLLRDDRISFDSELKSQSHSSSGISDNEVPSPAKLDLTPLADSITDGIMKALILESMKLPQNFGNDPRKDSEDFTTPTVGGLDVMPVPCRSDSLEVHDSRLQSTAVDSTTNNLLKQAIAHMLKIRHDKEDKLTLPKVVESNTLEKEKTNILSLLTVDAEDKVESIGTDMLAQKLNQLRDVHDQLGALLGDDNDYYDDDCNNENLDNNDATERLIMPPTGFGSEPELFIPYNENNTIALVRSAFDNVLKRESRLDLGKPADLLENLNNDNLDDASTKLYQNLIYDVTKGLLYDLKDFRGTQLNPRPPWMKIPKKTFSKFTRKSHVLKEKDLREVIAQHVCTCLDLHAGRPSLEKLKQKLPLNLSKKDYVDALLIEELRGEEEQWVNYDEDELRVKFQLADAILDSLINETVEILSLF